MDTTCRPGAKAPRRSDSQACDPPLTLSREKLHGLLNEWSRLVVVLSVGSPAIAIAVPIGILIENDPEAECAATIDHVLDY